MTKIIALFKKMPLTALILSSLLFFGITGLIGKYTFLSKFNSIDTLKYPCFSLSLFEAKDILNGEEPVLIPSGMQKKQSIQVAGKPKAAKKGDAPLSLEIPDASCNPVCPAADYGTANPDIMVDDSYVFNTDKEGMFAPNGTYFPLEKVDESYFKDALFIGDSRTVGLYYFSRLKGKTNFFCKESMNVFNLPVKELEYHGVDGEESSCLMDELLSTHKYSKIYICLGINEMGYPVTRYYEAFRNIVKSIRDSQPEAIIYIEGSMHVSALKSSTDVTFNNTSLVQRNKAISELANGRDIFYIDMNPAVCDENGDLIADYTTDGVHLKANEYRFWVDFLEDNAVVL